MVSPKNAQQIILIIFVKFQRKSFRLFFPPHVHAHPEPVQQGRQQKKSSLK